MEQFRNLDEEFVFRLDRRSGIPIYRQLIEQVLAALSTGVLKPGNRLPTLASVAGYLHIHRNTVARAYNEMELGGVIKTQHGGGTYIAARPTQRSPPERQRVLIELLTEFIARAGAAGFTVRELLDTLPQLVLEDEK